MVLICFLFIFSSMTTDAEPELVSILLLNSYHDGYQWSDDTKQGIRDVLDENISNYYLRVEHMDTKNINSDAYMDGLAKLYAVKYDRDEFDVIISADDNALKFLLEYKDDLFGDTPIFFTGVNKLDVYDLDDQNNIYGVVEKSSIATTVKVAQKQIPELKDVYLVVDDTITGQSTKADTTKDMAIYEDVLEFYILENMPYEDILKKVETLDPKESIVIQSFYVVDTDGTSYPLEYTAKQLTNRSTAPVYSIYSFGFGEGTVGGRFIEGYTQGTRVAMMLVDFLEDGHYNGQRYIVDESSNRYHFDYEVMKKFNLNVNALPEISFIINEPITFYDRNKTIINIGVILITLIMIYVGLLRRQITKQTHNITKTQKSLMESEKMASLGRLVAGVAHEVNTPIGIGVTLASYIDDETGKVQKLLSGSKLSQNKLNAFLDDIQVSSEMLTSTMHRASKLIQSFKQVAVDQSYDERRHVDLAQYLEEIINSLRSELKKTDVEIKINCADNLRIYSHTGAIYQIILNLIMNSIKHGFHDLDDGVVEITAYLIKDGTASGKHDAICLTYKDNGHGIKNGNLKKIFEPFYTTRRTEGGSGLGLNIVYNLVTQRLMGTVECKSILGEYTEFTILFPAEEQ